MSIQRWWSALSTWQKVGVGAAGTAAVVGGGAVAVAVARGGAVVVTPKATVIVGAAAKSWASRQS